MWMKSSPCGQLQPLEDTRREQPRHVLEYTLPVTMALHSYHRPTCVEAWLLFTMEQSVSNNKEVLAHERRHSPAGEITVAYT